MWSFRESSHFGIISQKQLPIFMRNHNAVPHFLSISAYLGGFFNRNIFTIASPGQAGALLLAAWDNEAGEKCKFLKVNVTSLVRHQPNLFLLLEDQVFFTALLWVATGTGNSWWEVTLLQNFSVSYVYAIAFVSCSVLPIFIISNFEVRPLIIFEVKLKLVVNDIISSGSNFGTCTASSLKNLTISEVKIIFNTDRESFAGTILNINILHILVKTSQPP